MTIPPFGVLALAGPVLLLGEFVVRRVRPLARVNIPTPIVGGFMVALAVVVFRLAGLPLRLEAKTASDLWNWWVVPTLRGDGQPRQLILPLMVVFYATLGLAASWRMVWRGGVFLGLFLLSTGVICILQNALGIGLAKALGQNAGLGLVCGSLSLMGGFSTSVAFAGPLEAIGLREAAGAGVAAATFGLVISNIVSAPLGTLLIRGRRLGHGGGFTLDSALQADSQAPSTLAGEVTGLGWRRSAFWGSCLLLLACAKLSAFVTAWLVAIGAENLPNQVGAMIVGLIVRNVHDLLGLRLLRMDIIERIGSVLLALFLAVATMTLDLTALGSVAGPMLVILLAQVGLTCAFAYWVNFRLMGRDYEAAVTSSGLAGFALGATPNAIAAIRSLERTFGPAPKAFLIVPVTGAFLSDVINVAIISLFIKWLA